MRILELSISGTVGTHDMGPISSVVCELSNQFVAQGHEVCLADPRADQPRAYLDSRVKSIDIDCGPAATLVSGKESFFRANLMRWRHAYKYLHRLYTLVDPKDYDIVHVHHPILGWLLRRVFRQRYALTCHNPALPRRIGGLKGLRVLPARLLRCLDRQAIKWAQPAVALGKDVAPHFPRASIATIPNGIDLDRWTPLDRASARRDLGIDKNDYVVVFTGRISPVKGVDILLDAAELLAPHIARLRIIVIGSLSGTFNGRERVSTYAQQVHERARELPVELKGFVNNKEPEFKQYLAAADVAAVPSRHEPQGLVVLEALAMGTPVVASDTGGIGGMINSEVGCLVAPGDSSALANALLALYQDPGARARMARRCRPHIERNWMWRQSASRYLQVFSDPRHTDANHRKPDLLTKGAPNHEI